MNKPLTKKERELWMQAWGWETNGRPSMYARYEATIVALEAQHEADQQKIARITQNDADLQIQHGMSEEKLLAALMRASNLEAKLTAAVYVIRRCVDSNDAHPEKEDAPGECYTCEFLTDPDSASKGVQSALEMTIGYNLVRAVSDEVIAHE